MTPRAAALAIAVGLLLSFRPMGLRAEAADSSRQSGILPDSTGAIDALGPEDAVADSAGDRGEETPAVVDRPARSPLDRAGALLLGEALAGHPGVEVIDRGYLGSQTEAWLEGLPADHWMTLFDEVPLTDPNRYTLDLDMVPAVGIERIAVERGPLLLEHGTRAVGGVLRIIPRPDQPGPARSQMRLATGSFGTGSFRGGFRREVGDARHGVWLGLNRVSTSGDRQIADLSLSQYHIGARTALGRDLWIRVTGAGASSELTAPGRIDGATSDARTETERRQVRLTASIFPEGPVPLEATAFFATTRRDSLDPETGERIDRRDGERGEIRFAGRWRAREDLSLTLAAGEEFLTGEDTGQVHAFSFFSGGTWTPWGATRVEAAGRWEREGTQYAAWSGALRLEREIAGGLSLFASGASVRHRPSLEGRTETTPLEGDGRIEGGLSLERGRIAHEVAGFRRRLRDDGSPAPGEAQAPGPTTELNVRGWRSSGRVEIVGGLSLAASYQWMDVRAHADFAPGRFIPRHLLQASVEVDRTLAEDVLGVEARLSGRYVRGREAPAAPGDREYGVADLHAGLRFVDVLFFVTVRNLLGDRPAIAEGFPVAGRAIRLGFAWDFLD